ncbi:hypothetical protein [Hymenobacter negativus]|uniref:Glycosyltransferase RgtA/B/C/D-like domain-containing protein n=1 Tax=Hymenobacter negativus TaxID=2795026 RepID=A0ABS3QP71_9BACT|nr:hypothetical protein [Hymenobacter negativus]MBO2012549.1 hypothetical protein [Hymenobacter negativus]
MPAAPQPARIMPWLLWTGALGLLTAAIALGLVVGTASYAQLQVLGQLPYHEFQYKILKLALTPDRLALLRALLVGAGVAGLLGTVVLHQQFQPAHGLFQEARLARRRFASWFRRQPKPEKHWAAVLLGLVLAARLWYLVSYPLSTDEMASHDFFAQRGPLTVTTYYPIPNNHIFYNLLAWPLAAAGLPALLAMRLPSLLLGFVGTALGYVLLARIAGARLALAVTGLVNLASLWVYYAMAGRGYFLQIGLLQAGFFATVELLQTPARYTRLAWLAFGISSVLGLYLIPSYAYPLVSLGAGLGLGFVWQRRWQALGQLVVVAVFVGLITVLLYAPVGAVSGWERLLHNPYVAAKTPAQFWPTYRAFLYETAATLFGPSLRVSGPVWLALALGGGMVSAYWLKKGHASLRIAAQLASLLLLMPLLLMVLQRVYAPTRVLLYLTFFGYLLGMLWLQRLPWERYIQARWQSPLLLLLVVSIGSYRLYENRSQVQALRHETQQVEAAYRWLRSQPQPVGQPARIWLHAIIHELFFLHYEQQEPAGRRDRLASQPATMATGGYDYLVIGRRPEDRKLPPPPPQYQARYHDDLVTIYQLTVQPNQHDR